jgi:hypothetical protein
VGATREDGGIRPRRRVQSAERGGSVGDGMHDAQMNSLGLISMVDGEMVVHVVDKVTRSGGGVTDFMYDSSHICSCLMEQSPGR